MAAGSVLPSAAVAAAAATLQEPSLDARAIAQQEQQQQQHMSAAAVAAAAAGILPGDPDPAGDALIDWLNSNGGEVRKHRAWAHQRGWAGQGGTVD